MATTNNPIDTTIPSASNPVGADLTAIRNNMIALVDSQIVEHNLNVSEPDNGYYVRWENGLQVCFVYSSEVDFSSRSQFVYDNIIFAADFTNRPICAIKPFSGAPGFTFDNADILFDMFASSANDGSLSREAVGVAGSTNSDEQRNMQALGIGSWK